MAYHDEAFKLGMLLTMDLVLKDKDYLIRENKDKDYLIRENGVTYAGKHIIIDLFNAKQLTDIHHIENVLNSCIRVANATLIEMKLHHFNVNQGVSGVAVLSESHISIHTCPEYEYAALDIFMCGDSKPELCVDILKKGFNTENVKVEKILRGIFNE
jgi:S-adenosylmethionine decarboxylase